MEATNNFGEVVYGASVPVSVPDYTDSMLAGMRQKQAQEDEAIRDAQRQKRAREEKLNKYKNDLSKWTLTQDKGIWQGRAPEVKAMAEDIFQTMMKNRTAQPNSYDPESDNELFTKMHDFQRATDEFQQEKKSMDQHMAIALDPKKRDTYNVNEDALAAWGKGDVEGLRKSLSKNIYGDESRADEINTYSGVGFLNPIDTTDWHTQTVKAAKGLQVPVRAVDIGGGKIKKTQQLSPEEKVKAYETWSTGAGAKLRASLVAQAQANNPFFPEEKADELLKDLFISNITDKQDLKGSQPRMSSGEKFSEKLFSTPYKVTGKDGRENVGINVGIIGTNTGLKSDLQSGNDQLKDVDLKTIYKTPDGQVEAIVMEYVYDQRPMTADEQTKERQNASVQMREPVFTKTVRSEKPRVVDFNPGSNNYNTIVGQYPGVEAKVQELISAPIPSPSSSKGREQQPAAGKIKLTEAEWTKKWAALPKGKTMVGLDGKTYTKK